MIEEVVVFGCCKVMGEVEYNKRRQMEIEEGSDGKMKYPEE